MLDIASSPLVRSLVLSRSGAGSGGGSGSRVVGGWRLVGRIGGGGSAAARGGGGVWVDVIVARRDHRRHVHIVPRDGALAHEQLAPPSVLVAHGTVFVVERAQREEELEVARELPLKLAHAARADGQQPATYLCVYKRVWLG